MRAGTLIVGIAAAALLSAGCTAADEQPNAEPSGDGKAAAGSTTLRTAYQADIATFDPDNGFEVAGLGAIRAVYEGLVDYEPGTTDVVGRLASSWTVSPDATTYTFVLREGVTFHSGEAMTSADVKASFDRRATPDLILSYFLANVASTETPDDKTFVVTLKSPQPSFLDNLASAWGPKILGPEALTENAGDDGSKGWLNEHADGTGPFRLASFSRGQEYVLERFEAYWGAAPGFQKVSIKIVPDIGQQVLQLRNGDLDAVLHGYPFTQLAKLPDGLAIESYNDLGLEMAFVNTTRTLTTVEQRRRVAAALAPTGWVQDAFGEFAAPAQALYPKAMLTPETPYAYPTQADSSNAVPALQIAYAAEEASVQQRVADLLIAQLGEAGIEATARALPGSDVSGFIKNLGKAPDIWLAQNNPDSAHPDSQASLFYATGAPLNIFGYSNPKADGLFAEGASATDPAKRDRLYTDGGRLVFEDGAFLPLADVADAIVYREGLSDFGTRPAIPWTLDFGTVRRG